MFQFNVTSDACVKCGKCIPVCTIHEVNRDEVTSPRGFLDLLGAYQRGELELDKNVKIFLRAVFYVPIVSLFVQIAYLLIWLLSKRAMTFAKSLVWRGIRN